MPVLIDTVKISADLEIPLTSSFGYLVGHYLGDGGAYDGALNDTRFTSTEPSHLSVVAKYLHEVGLVAKPIHGDGIHRGYYVNNANLYRWFREQFDSLCRTKRLPEWVFLSPFEFRIGMLDGLISSDGAVGATAGRNRDGYQINIGLSNPGLIDQTIVLCRTLGILVSV